MPDQLNPGISGDEAIAAFQLIYPTEFAAILEVIGNAKRLALIPTEPPPNDTIPAPPEQENTQ